MRIISSACYPSPSLIVMLPYSLSSPSPFVTSFPHTCPHPVSTGDAGHYSFCRFPPLVCAGIRGRGEAEEPEGWRGALQAAPTTAGACTVAAVGGERVVVLQTRRRRSRRRRSRWPESREGERRREGRNKQLLLVLVSTSDKAGTLPSVVLALALSLFLLLLPLLFPSPPLSPPPPSPPLPWSEEQTKPQS